MAKKPLTPEKAAKLLAELRSYDNPNYQISVFKAGATSSKSKELFANQLPAVREKALEHLARLMKKHKAKLELKGKGQYYGILCGISIRLAKGDLGLIISSKKAFRRAKFISRRKSSIRTQLGLQPPQHDPVYYASRRANVSQTPNV